MGPTDDLLPTVDPSIQQRGQLRVVKLSAGMRTLIQVGASGKTARMQSGSAGWVDGLSGSFLGLLEMGRGRGTFLAMSTGSRCWW